MLALPTIVILFLLGPMVLIGFVAAFVLPTLYIALRSKIRDPEGLPKKANQGATPSP
ncbi:MAG: hypothetical protein O3B84_07300 [Chloroflexi bacterium]|nr:hypothetical protein [Chloroflexota bacterium]